MPDPLHHATLPHALAAHARTSPDRLLYRFLPTGDDPAATWTFADTDRRARAVAQQLLQRSARGRTVLIAHPAGPDFVAAFLGCLYAGAIAVPLLPPRLNAGPRRPAAERFAAIVNSAQPALLMAPAAAAAPLAHAAGRPDLPTLTPDTPDLQPADLPLPDPTDLACIQYTSGTSGTPRGVMLSHAALAANARMIAHAFGHSPASRGVIWLPPHHDMGLVGGILQPLFAGFEVTLMPAAAFLQQPLRWLHAVSRYRATTSGGPTFAYALCCDAIPHPDSATLDLSSWEVAFVGAEPVRAATMQRFARHFAACGFRASAIVPCYGLAEATLMVSCAPRNAGLHTAPANAPVPHTVSCGPAVEPAHVAIVDPTTAAPLPENTVGEVWVHSPALGAGYWNDPQRTADTFHARMPDDPRPFLRTGDLAFLHHGQLHITGRLKDLLIIRGANHMPHDLEATAEAAHPAIQPAASAAFSLATDSGEAAALACELRREHRRADPHAIAAALRAAIADAHDLELAAIFLLPPASIPRTTSGKIQRALCRERCLAGELEPLFTWTLRRAPDGSETVADAPPADLTQPALAGWLAARLARVAGLSPAQIDPTEPLARYGLGSADAVGLAGQISAALNIDLPATALWDYPTLRELSHYLHQQLAADPSLQAAPVEGGS